MPKELEQITKVGKNTLKSTADYSENADHLKVTKSNSQINQELKSN
jgi:hypothetical protein